MRDNGFEVMPEGRMGPKFFVPMAAGSFKADLLREGVELQGRHIIVRESEVTKLK